MARRTQNRTKLEVIPEFACGRFRLRLGQLPYPRYSPTHEIEYPVGIMETTHSSGTFASVEDAEDFYQALGAAIAYWKEHGHMVIGTKPVPPRS